MSPVFKVGDRVEIIKNRVDSDPIIGKTGTVVGSTCTVHPFWNVRLDGKTYSSDNLGALLKPSEIQIIE